MRMLILIPFFLTNFTSSQAEKPPAPATRTLLSSCPDAKPVMLAYFTEHGFTQITDTTCPDCIELRSDALQDASGNKIAARRIIQDYVENPLPEKRPFGVWVSYSKPLAKATLRLAPASNGCLASLLFDYTWTSTEVIAAIPKDGDPESRPSNRRLERQYLDSITVRVLHAP